MADITAALVKQLREATNVSMMECKRALQEAEGDMALATKLLRERGMAVAAKKSTRTANQGLIATDAADEGKTVSLVEVNCETDFVARNDNFINFVAALAAKGLETEGSLAEEVKDIVIAKVAEIGENIIVSKSARYQLQGSGTIGSYIHLGGKVGVLVEVGCEKAETVENDAFKALVSDLTLHIAACNPAHLDSSAVPESDIAAEREIFVKQVEGKPENIIDKIVAGKIKKYFSEICMLDQGFVKEPKQSIADLLDVTGKTVGDTLTIRRFERFQLGV